MTHNEFTVKDSFDAVNRIQNIPSNVFDEGYSYVSFDVESLFTNVPLRRTVNVIINRIYNDKLINTNLRKSTLKKLILDSCQKTTFSFQDKLYEQVDGVSMGSSLGPVLANIIMTELEKVVINSLIEQGIVKFYIRYVDDTLLLVKNKDIEKVKNSLNGFDPNLKFTVDKFDSESDVHFLDILIDKNKTDVYYKKTNTGQYTHFTSFTPWRLKISWINALFIRARKICSEDSLFHKQLAYIRKVMSWNGYPKYVGEKILKNLIHKDRNQSDNSVNSTEKENISEIFIKLPYCGTKGEKLLSMCTKRIARQLSTKVKFMTIFSNKKILDFCSVKDHIPNDQKHNVIYKIQCPGCQKQYIGKTSCCVGKRLHEHAEKADQPMFLHLKECDSFQECISLMNLPDIDKIISNTISADSHILSAVLDNYKIIDVNHNGSHLAFLETYYIKKYKPDINDGLKACVDFKVFNF